MQNTQSRNVAMGRHTAWTLFAEQENMRNRWGKDKLARHLNRRANMRRAKELKRLQAVADGWTPEPRMTRKQSSAAAR